LFCIDRKTNRLNGECRKLSIKVDANKFRTDSQKINGQKRLMFHGMAVQTLTFTPLSASLCPYSTPFMPPFVTLSAPFRPPF
jgi:hypothetical protein